MASEIDDGRDAALQMRGISKRFGATQALLDVSLDAYSGEVLALIGENGAGKSTLMKVLSGAHSADAGTLQLDGRPFVPSGPNHARSAGIAIVYQELNLAPDLSVEDNIMLGIERGRLGWLSRGDGRLRIREALELLGHPDLDISQPISRLSIGLQQLVEIARALVSDAKVIVFDEPTSSLPQHDVQQLFTVIKRLQDKGLAIIYISHFLEEIREVASRYCVLRDGRPAGNGQLVDTSDAAIVSLMVGRDVDTLFPRVDHEIGDCLLDVDQLCGSPMPKGVSLQVRRGEILGLFGLVGAGRTETLRNIFGMDRPVSGVVRVGEARASGDPRSRIRQGMGLVSEDRKGEGLSQDMSIEDNLTLSDLGQHATLGWIDLAKRRKVVDEWMHRLQVKAQDSGQSISSLSGGNQQKVAIARVLHQDADILLFDEPTRGIDVGTKSEIYRLVGELAASGKAIIFVSSYLPELMAVCDTVGVMGKGRLLGLRDVSQWTENEILSTAISS
ncbi:MAG: sugar ABC transporter ATP-binding protein [Aureliella sp.]